MVERLNVASHRCAVAKRDDLVLRSLLADEKLPTLLHLVMVLPGGAAE